MEKKEEKMQTILVLKVFQIESQDGPIWCYPGQVYDCDMENATALLEQGLVDFCDPIVKESLERINENERKSRASTKRKAGHTKSGEKLPKDRQRRRRQSH